MPVYAYEKTRQSKKSNKRITETSYYYQGKYTDPITKERKQYKKRGFKRKADAEIAEREFLQSINFYTVREKITYGEVFNMFYEDRAAQIKASSLKLIETRYRTHIKPYWDKIKLDELTLAMVLNWQKELLNGTYTKKINGKETVFTYTNHYLRSVQETFKAGLSFAIKLGYNIDQRVIHFDYVKNKAEKKKEMLFWHPEEFYKFIDQADDIQYEALFNILYWCGLRIGEALALRWEDIDLDKQSITVNKTYDRKNNTTTTPKTENSYRTVIMPRKCFESVLKWYNEANYYDEDKPLHLVFGTDRALPDKAIRLTKALWCERAGVKVIRTHDFRHSHVSLLINQGFSAFDISKRLGHTVDMVNNIYGHWFNDSQQRMVDKLNNL